MKRDQSGHVVVVLKLHLDLAVVAPDGLGAQRAGEADSGAGPAAIWPFGRKPAIVDRCLGSFP
jgi:hypothetical protein